MFGVINRFRFSLELRVTIVGEFHGFKIFLRLVFFKTVMEIYVLSFKAFNASPAVLTTIISFIDAE